MRKKLIPTQFTRYTFQVVKFEVSKSKEIMYGGFYIVNVWNVDITEDEETNHQELVCTMYNYKLSTNYTTNNEYKSPINSY